jgi:hypothetical protein
MFLSIEEVAPRVISGISETINVDDFNVITGVPKYRGAFVRIRKLSGDDTSFPYDTIVLSNGTAWVPTETVGTSTYNNRPFGIIGSYPQKINEPDGGGIQGKLTIHVLGGRQPAYVAFRFVDNAYNFTRPPESLIGRRVYIHGKQVNITGTNFIVPVASTTSITGVEPLYVKDIIMVPRLVRSLLPAQRDVGWVLLALDHNFLREPF